LILDKTSVAGTLLASTTGSAFFAAAGAAGACTAMDSPPAPVDFKVVELPFIVLPAPFSSSSFSSLRDFTFPRFATAIAMSPHPKMLCVSEPVAPRLVNQTFYGPAMDRRRSVSDKTPAARFVLERKYF
jgi:hypothetical protein